MQQYYNDATDSADSADSAASPEPKPNKSEMDGKTALLPRKLFGDHECKEGDTYTVRVVKTYNDDVEVELVPDKEEEAGEPDENENSMDAAMNELDSMNTKKE